MSIKIFEPCQEVKLNSQIINPKLIIVKFFYFLFKNSIAEVLGQFKQIFK